MRPRATWRLFAIYLAVTAVPVVALGLLLASGLRSEAQDRRVREGRAQAALLAETAIVPHLTGGRLKRPFSPGEQASLSAVARRLIVGHEVLRLRLRDHGGHVVFSDDGSGFARLQSRSTLRCAPSRMARSSGSSRPTSPTAPSRRISPPAWMPCIETS